MVFPKLEISWEQYYSGKQDFPLSIKDIVSLAKGAWPEKFDKNASKRASSFIKRNKVHLSERRVKGLNDKRLDQSVYNNVLRFVKSFPEILIF
jgi:hypothetical protein